MNEMREPFSDKKNKQINGSQDQPLRYLLSEFIKGSSCNLMNFFQYV